MSGIRQEPDSTVYLNAAVRAAWAVVVFIMLSETACTSRYRKVEARGDTVHECDTLAAHPNDGKRMASGVSDDQIVPALAVARCEAAVSTFPGTARFRFQLGRALLASSQLDEARRTFDKANELGHCAAKHYLAEIAVDAYLRNGDEKEMETARRLFHESEACGFGPSAQRVAELTFTLDGFHSPRIIEALFNENLEELNEARFLVANYCRGIHDYISLDFHPTDQNCPALTSKPAITFDLDAAAAGDPRATRPWESILYTLGLEVIRYIGPWVDPVWRANPEKYKEYLHSFGKRDGQHLIQRFGCRGDITVHVYDQIVAFAKAKKPLLEYKDKVLERAKFYFADPAQTAAESASAVNE